MRPTQDNHANSAVVCDSFIRAMTCADKAQRQYVVLLVTCDLPPELHFSISISTVQDHPSGLASRSSAGVTVHAWHEAAVVSSWEEWWWHLQGVDVLEDG
jgi:hypothetical protein